MADFKYTGQPTAGGSTKDIKLPKTDGTFAVIASVVPDVTVISTEDAECINFMQSNPNFQQQ
ncbi:hypothetical protein N9948_02145 [bacterium]|nr:hypothetical protein [bacterium]